MSFSEILQPTIEFAEHGFPVYATMSNRIGLSEDKFNDLYPTTGEIYLNNGKARNTRRDSAQPGFR